MEWYRTTLRLDPDLHASLAQHATYFGCSQQHLLRELLRVSLEKIQEFCLLSPEDQALFMPEGEGLVVLPSLPGSPASAEEEGRKVRLDRQAEVASRGASSRRANAVTGKHGKGFPTREE